jgi:hypothetical protein
MVHDLISHTELFELPGNVCWGYPSGATMALLQPGVSRSHFSMNIPDFFKSSFVLYMIYYPEHLKYDDTAAGEHEALLPRPSNKENVKSVECRLSLIAAWIVGLHLYVSAFLYVAALIIILFF